jgi:hypothetical protein
MAACVLLISVARAFLFFWCALRAATSLHDDAAAAVLRAPLAFFHTNPTGRVLNRFSKDQGAIDEQLPQVAFDAVQAMMMVRSGERATAARPQARLDFRESRQSARALKLPAAHPAGHRRLCAAGGGGSFHPPRLPAPGPGLLVGAAPLHAHLPRAQAL